MNTFILLKAEETDRQAGRQTNNDNRIKMVWVVYDEQGSGMADSNLEALQVPNFHMLFTTLLVCVFCVQ